VRVNGIVVSESSDPWFILGVLNARVADFVFRRIAKVKDGGFFEANKQFIAPLPVPPATRKQREDVAARAKELQSVHSARRDILMRIEQRLSIVRTLSKPETWLFPFLKSKRDLLAAAPARLNDDKKREWAGRRYELDVAAAHELITARLRPGATLSAAFLAGELSFSIDGVRVVERIYVTDEEGEFVVAQWKILAATFGITDNTDGKKLANALRKVGVRDNPAVVQQVIALEAELSAIEAKIAAEERDMNALVDHLYDLSDAEARLLTRLKERTTSPEP
jgi:hypothetical protein